MSRLLGLGAGAGAVLVVVLVAVLAARQPEPRPAALTAASPSDGATLAQAPAAIDLAFTGPVNAELSHVSVRTRAGTTVSVGEPRLVASNRLHQPVDRTATGDLTVAYHVILRDGADLVGTLHVLVTPRQANGPADTKSSAAAISPAPAQPGHQHGIDPVSAVLLVLDGIVGLTVVMLLLVRPRPGYRTGSRRAVCRSCPP